MNDMHDVTALRAVVDDATFVLATAGDPLALHGVES